MSLILDALRKSDIERAHQQAPQVAGVHTPTNKPKRVPWVWIACTLLLINIAFLYFLLVKKDAPVENDIAVVMAAPIKPAAKSQDSRSVAQGGAASVETPRTKSPVQSLLAQTSDTQPEASANTSTSQAATQNTGSRATSTPSPSSSERDKRADDLASLPSMAELYARGETNLPSLHIDLHVYTLEPNSRFVFINGRRANEGDRLSEGPQVIQITPIGVVLEDRGLRFLLTRD